MNDRTTDCWTECLLAKEIFTKNFSRLSCWVMGIFCLPVIIETPAKSIRQWPINWCISPMIIHKNTHSVDYNLWLKRLDTQLNNQTNQNSLKVLKVVKTTNKKTLLWIFGDYCNKQSNVPSLPYFVYLWWLRHLPNAGHPLQWLCFSPLSRTGLPVHSFVTNARPTSHLSVSSSCF